VAAIDPERDQARQDARRGLRAAAVALVLGLLVWIWSQGITLEGAPEWALIASAVAAALLSAAAGVLLARAGWELLSFVEEAEASAGFPDPLAPVNVSIPLLAGLALAALAGGLALGLQAPWGLASLPGPWPTDPFTVVRNAELLLTATVLPFAVYRLQIGLNRAENAESEPRPDATTDGSPAPRGDTPHRVAGLTVLTLGLYLFVWLARASGALDEHREGESGLRERLRNFVLGLSGLALMAAVVAPLVGSGLVQGSMKSPGLAAALTFLVLGLVAQVYLLIQLVGLWRGVFQALAEVERRQGDDAVHPGVMMGVLFLGSLVLAATSAFLWALAFLDGDALTVGWILEGMQRTTPLAGLPVVAYVLYRCQQGLDRTRGPPGGSSEAGEHPDPEAAPG
jgi:hypothetical protein